MKVNVISESAFTVQGHGVHTAYVETITQLRGAGIDVLGNTGRPADIVHIHTIGPYSVWRMLRTRARARVVSAHVTPDSFVGSLIGAKYWYGVARRYLRWFYGRADAVLAVSHEVSRELKAMGLKKPIYVVPNTIDTRAFACDAQIRTGARQRLGLPSDAFIVVGSGQVQPRKRIDSFVAAAKAVPDAYFVWVGGIPFKQLAADSRDMSAVIKHPPANARFTGQIPRADVVSYYQAADLFFLPSAQETFGIVIVEGAAAGLPVLLRDIAQYRETFGEWYAAADDTTFASVIARFMSDPAFYRDYKNKAGHLAEAYDSAAGAKQLVGVYESVLKGKTG